MGDRGRASKPLSKCSGKGKQFGLSCSQAGFHQRRNQIQGGNVPDPCTGTILSPVSLHARRKGRSELRGDAVCSQTSHKTRGL